MVPLHASPWVWSLWESELVDSSKNRSLSHSLSHHCLHQASHLGRSNISPLIAEQYRDERPFIRVEKNGERVIVDPAATIARVYMYFYLMINVGSLCGQISMVYAERYIGFWLSFLLPTIMFCFCPMILFLCRKRYYLMPPTGSVYSKAFRVWAIALKGRFTLNPVRWFTPNPKSDELWNRAKPSYQQGEKPAWMTFDDEWVDEVRRGLKACRVFLWYPLYCECFAFRLERS